MSSPGVILFAAAAGAAVVLAIRMFLKNTKARMVLGVIGVLLLAAAALIVSASMFPGPLAAFTPYEHLGTFTSADLDHRECIVDVYAKALSNVRPPGTLPRVKLVASRGTASATITYDTGWRFWIGNVRPVEGGIEIYHSYPRGGGVRFHLKDDHWLIANEGVLGVAPRDLPPSDLERLPEELRPVLNLIHNSPGLEAGWFNPTALIRSVNGLHAVGKEKAIQALRAYDQVAHGRESPWGETGSDRILPILHLLFSPARGAPGRPGLRESVLEHFPGVDWSEWPLFPLVIEDDIPYLLAPHYSRYAHEDPPDVKAHLDYASQHGVLRDRPLIPKGTPCQSAEKIMANSAWKALVEHGNSVLVFTQDLRLQALVATHTIYPVTAAQYNALDSNTAETRDEEWARDVKALKGLMPRWDVRTQDFLSGKERR